MWFSGFAPSRCCLSHSAALSLGSYGPPLPGSRPLTSWLQLDEITATAFRPDGKAQGRLTRLGRRLLGDGLLAYVTYSLLFVAVFNSGTNAEQFGRLVLVASQATDPPPAADCAAPRVNGHLMRFIAILTLSVMCLMQWGFPAVGRGMNQLWALVKIIFIFLLIALLINAVVLKGESLQQRQDGWKETHQDTPVYNPGAATLGILFSFQGWENATFVSSLAPREGEELNRVPPQRVGYEQ